MVKKALTRKGSQLAGYDKVLGGVAELLESARRASARATNAVMTRPIIGRRIVEFEQKGLAKADYGEQLIETFT